MKELYDGTQVPLDTPTKLISGKRYLLTQDEITEKEEREAISLTRRLIEKPKQLRRSVSGNNITINGMEFKPDQDTLMAVVGLVRLLEEINDPDKIISFEAENGFFDLNLQQIKDVGVVLGGLQQKAFDTQKTLQAEVADGTLTTSDAVEIRFAELMEA